MASGKTISGVFAFDAQFFLRFRSVGQKNGVFSDPYVLPNVNIPKKLETTQRPKFFDRLFELMYAIFDFRMIGRHTVAYQTVRNGQFFVQIHRTRRPTFQQRLDAVEARWTRTDDGQTPGAAVGLATSGLQNM
uniref:Uncharacterized protein n=1 Tax=Romanomermis culicivorax TaxID=13658 RepID=A0A915JIG4_ROMCU